MSWDDVKQTNVQKANKSEIFLLLAASTRTVSSEDESEKGWRAKTVDQGQKEQTVKSGQKEVGVQTKEKEDPKEEAKEENS